MKALLLMLITFICAIIIMALPIDAIQSMIPSWKTHVLPSYIRYSVIGMFNIGFPILFYLKLKTALKSQIIITYFLIINLLLLMSEFWPKNFVENGKINYETYTNYALTLVYLFLAAMSIHLLFYIYVLVRLMQKKQLKRAE